MLMWLMVFGLIAYLHQNSLKSEALFKLVQAYYLFGCFSNILSMCGVSCLNRLSDVTMDCEILFQKVK